MEWGGTGLGMIGATDNSPSLDRITNMRGYVPGNVVWISTLANRVKSSATVDQLFRVARFFDRLQHLQQHLDAGRPYLH